MYVRMQVSKLMLYTHACKSMYTCTYIYMQTHTHTHTHKSSHFLSGGTHKREHIYVSCVHSKLRFLLLITKLVLYN